MSSFYRLLCLNHDPVIPGEGQIDQEREILSIARTGASDHAACDVLIGRYYYGLVAVCCPGTHGRGDPGGRACGLGDHQKERWAEREWIELLAHAYHDGRGVPPALIKTFERSCWTRTRMARLGPLLGISGDGSPAETEPEDTPA